MDWEGFEASFEGKPSSGYAQNSAEIWERLRSPRTSVEVVLDPSRSQGASGRYQGNVVVHGGSDAHLYDPHSQIESRVFLSGDSGSQSVPLRLDELDFRPSDFHQWIFDALWKNYHGPALGGESSLPGSKSQGPDRVGWERSKLLGHLTSIVGRASDPWVAVLPNPLVIGGTHSLSDWLRSAITHVLVDEHEPLASTGSMAATTFPQGRVLHPLAEQFALGIDDETPDPRVVRIVDLIARTVDAKTRHYVYSVDADGAFSFDAWLSNDLFVMCEIDLYGEINAGLYQSPTGPQESFLSRITEDELLDIL